MNRKNEIQTKVRRQQILDAAVHCFRKDGIHGTSLADIADAAGMSTGHVYYYIKNKDELVEAIVAREHEKLKTYIDQLRPLVARPKEAVTFIQDVYRKETENQEFVLLSQIFAEAAINPTVAAILEKRNRMFQDEMGELLRQGVDGGQIAPQTNIDALVTFTLFLSLGLVAHAAIDREGSQRNFAKLLDSGLERLFEPA